MREQVLQAANAQAHEMTLWIFAGALALAGAWSIARACGASRVRRLAHERRERRSAAVAARVAQSPARPRRMREVVR